MKKFRLFFIWQVQKEEAWLNRMSAAGNHCIHTNGFAYTFVKDPSKSYTYRLDFIRHLKSTERLEYQNLVQESGAEKVATFQNWIYFRRPTSLGPFVLYSDNQSRIELHKRLRSSIQQLFAIEFVLLFALYPILATHSLFTYLAAGLLLAVIVLLATCLLQLQKQLKELKRRE